MKKGSIHRASAQKEIAVHAKAALHQSNTTEDTRLMRLQEVFVNASTRETSLIMELARGGDLFDRYGATLPPEPNLNHHSSRIRPSRHSLEVRVVG